MNGTLSLKRMKQAGKRCRASDEEIIADDGEEGTTLVIRILHHVKTDIVIRSIGKLVKQESIGDERSQMNRGKSLRTIAT